MSDLSAITRDRLDPRNIELMDPAVLPRLRAMTPGERMFRIHTLFRRMREMGQGGIRNQHPDWTSQQVEAEFRRRLEFGRS